MADRDDDAVASQVDALALEEAELEAAEAEALAAAARAKARAARLRRQALAGTAEDDDSDADDEDEYDDEYEDDEEYEDEDYYDEDEDEDEELDEPESVAATENYSEAAPVAKPSRRERLRGAVPIPKLSTIAMVAAVALILTFLGFSGYFVWQHHDATDRQQRSDSYLEGAKKGVVNMTSLDYTKAKDDVQRVIDSSTGEFRDDFERRAADFTKVVEQSKVVTEGTVNAAAIESMDEHSALVLISVSSHITNGAGPKTPPPPWRLRVTVTEQDGQYKMSKVEFVP